MRPNQGKGWEAVGLWKHGTAMVSCAKIDPVKTESRLVHQLWHAINRFGGFCLKPLSLSDLSEWFSERSWSRNIWFITIDGLVQCHAFTVPATRTTVHTGAQVPRLFGQKQRCQNPMRSSPYGMLRKQKNMGPWLLLSFGGLMARLGESLLDRGILMLDTVLKKLGHGILNNSCWKWDAWGLAHKLKSTN